MNLSYMSAAGSATLATLRQKLGSPWGCRLSRLGRSCDGLRQVEGRLTGGGIDGDQLGEGVTVK